MYLGGTVAAVTLRCSAAAAIVFLHSVLARMLYVSFSSKLPPQALVRVLSMACGALAAFFYSVVAVLMMHPGSQLLQ